MLHIFQDDSVEQSVDRDDLEAFLEQNVDPDDLEAFLEESIDDDLEAFLEQDTGEVSATGEISARRKGWVNDWSHGTGLIITEIPQIFIRFFRNDTCTTTITRM